jgi:pre-mRNA-processing factor 19
MIGHVFEKRLIEAYISDNGRDPVTNEETTLEDLLELKSSHTVKPRPPTLTSIPALLAEFQAQWDALALETYTLRRELAQTRQELSTTLYQNDAAVRVIARLTQERDESRDALSRVSISGGAGANGDSMQIDAPGLSQTLIAKVEATQEQLSKTRRKRPVPEDWATGDDIEAFKPRPLGDADAPNATCLEVDATGEMALFGAEDGSAGVFSLSKGELVQKMKSSSGGVTSVAWVDRIAAIASKSGTVQIFEDGSETAKFSAHAGAATAIAAHPSGAILASVGVDKSFIFYDLEANTVATQVFTNAGELPYNNTFRPTLTTV